MLLYDRMQRVRAAARFVFRHQPDVVRDVTSAYARRLRAAHRSKAAEATNGAVATPAAPAAPAE